MMLPWLVIGLTNCTSYARFTRGQMVETLSEDYIRTAQSKGVRTNRVLFKHALRAAIVPVVTIFGLDFATLLARHDLHRADLQHRRHRPLGPPGPARPRSTSTSSARTVLVAAVLIVVANLVVDIFYSFLDPRVSVG